MKFEHYKYFHELTTDRSDGGRVVVPDDPAKWPPEWKEVQYKEYALFKQLPLPPVRGSFFEILASKRSSSKDRLAQNNPSLVDVAYIIKCGYGLVSDTSFSSGHRTVPSAGARYPLEIYLFIFSELENLPQGIYHYNVRTHALEPVQQRVFSESDKRAISPLPWLATSRGMICMSAVFGRTTEKYGERGYRYLLLEAGHVAQNMQLAATERNMVLVPVGGVEDEVLEQLICLNSARERLVYSLCF